MKTRLPSADALAATIGIRVRSLRIAASLTQEKLAYESGLRSKGTLSKIEAGQQLATVPVLELLARRLGVELIDLFVTPGDGDLRHDLIEATRGLAIEDLRNVLAQFPQRASSRNEPFVDATPPRRKQAVPESIPLVELEVAAGGFDARVLPRQTRWVRPTTKRKLHPSYFVTRIVGHSMEPTIRDGAWVMFSQTVSPDPLDRIVIARYGGLVDADTAGSFTIKRYAGVHLGAILLRADNPSFDDIVVPAARLAELAIVAELVEVLGLATP